MRWKFLVIVSIVAALLACSLWCSVVLLFFGPASIVRLNSLWPLSFAIPLAGSFAAALFVYRHTSRRRKLQAVIATCVVIVLIAAGYFVAAKLLPTYLTIPYAPTKVVPTRAID